jgi:hypothetical protein
MCPDLQRRIQKVYPEGTISSMDEEELKDADRDKRIRTALDSVAKEWDLIYHVQPFDKPDYSIGLTQADHPTFDEWVWSMNNAAKIRWITEHGSPYPVLWLKVSRVADFYYLFYNHWKPRGDTGYLDADFRDEPNEHWMENQKILEGHLQKHGFSIFPDSLASQKTSLVQVRDYDSIADDDPRWNDDDFEPPLVNSTLHECLFSD